MNNNWSNYFKNLKSPHQILDGVKVGAVYKVLSADEVGVFLPKRRGKRSSTFSSKLSVVETDQPVVQIAIDFCYLHKQFSRVQPNVEKRLQNVLK